MLFLSSFWDKVGSSILEAFRSLMLSLCEIVYKFIIFFFDIFLMIGNSSILDDTTVQELYERVGLILGLFMVFRVIFSLVQYVMDPDMMMDKQKGVFNIVKRAFIVIVLLGTTRFLFDLAYDAQRVIVTSNIIPKIITGQNVGTDDFGGSLAEYTFTSFYRYNEKASTEEKEKCDDLFSGTISEDLRRDSSLRYAYNCLNETGGDGDDKYFIIDFDGHGIVALLVGGFILWMIIMYVVQVGVRVVQLAYLELIAPIPIISYLAPKGEETLNKWFKQCTTTYLDFFIRVAIIYLVVFMIQLLMNTDGSHFADSLGETSGWDMLWINIIMILALLLFANKAPGLLKELFPSLGGGAAGFSFGLNPKKELNNPLTAGAFGMVGGAVGAGLSNSVHGFMNMKKTWNKNSVGKSWSKMTDEERANTGMTEEKYESARMDQVAKRLWATTKTGGKGIVSTAGGVVGGGKAGLKTKDAGRAVKVANDNRERRELKTKTGYHLGDALHDKVLSFAGEGTSAGNQIKAAEFRKDALQQAKSMKWQSFAETKKDEIAAGTIDLSLLRSMQKIEVKGQNVWMGIDKNGKERTFKIQSTKDSNGNVIATNFIATDGGINILADDGGNTIYDSSEIDKNIKEQGKIIKGFQVADRDAKK